METETLSFEYTWEGKRFQQQGREGEGQFLQ